MNFLSKTILIFLLTLVIVPFASADPAISEEYSHISETSAFIYWQTSEAVDSYVEYGPTTTYGSQTTLQENNIMEALNKVNVHHGFYTHAHYVTNLQRNTLYHYRLVMIDENNNYFYGPDQTFTTQDYPSKIEVPGSLSGPMYTLDQDNTVYVLTEDIVASGGAIHIIGNGITFDMNGHTITYNNVHDGGTSGNQGIDVDGSNTLIVNGRIVQGAGNDAASASSSVGHNPILIGHSLSNNEVAGVYMQWSGLQVGGLMHSQSGGTGFQVHHNTFYDLGNGIDGFTGRETMVKSIWLPPYVESTVHHNLIRRTRHSAISHNYGNGGSGDIYNNEVYTDSQATNAFGIYFTGDSHGGQVYNNKFFATGYHAVSMALMGGPSNWNIHDNEIVMWATDADCRWTVETGPLYHCPMSSMNGVRVMWASPTNCQFYNNNITIYGESPGSYGRGAWLFQRTTPLGIDFHDNTITTYGDADTEVCSIGANGYTDQDQAQFRYYDNVIESDICNVRFTDEYGTARNTLLENNIIRRIGNNPDYHTIVNGWWNLNADGHIFRDNILEGGADLRNVVWRGYYDEGITPSLDYLVEWTLNINVLDGQGGHLSNADITIRDKDSNVVYTTTTGGSTVSRVLPEFYNYHVSDYTYATTDYAPYTVTVDYLGWQYVEQIPLDQTTTMNIIYDPSAPSISSTECQINGVWQSCESIQYNDVINQIRTTCDDPDGVGITSARFSLYNNFDQSIILQGSQPSSGTPVTVTWNNNDYTIEDSGGFELNATCTDVQGKTATQTITWSLPWGTLSAQHNLPSSDPYQINNGESFTYQTTISCSGGECGTVTATLDPFDDTGWQELYKEDFNTPTTYTDGQTFGTNNWLTAQTYNNGQIVVQNGYAIIDTSSSFADMAMIRSTNNLPEFHKVRAKIGFVEYDLDNYDSSDYNDPNFNDHQGYYENGVYFLTLTDNTCSGSECAEQWWHNHRKAVIDVDNHLEWGTGTLVNHPIYMVYFGPELDSSGGGNVIRSWDGSVWHDEEWNWEIAYTYQPDTWYFAEIEKMYNKLILRLYDQNENIITETSPVRDDLVYKLEDAIEYLYLGEPHVDDYKGSARFDEITLLTHDSHSCGDNCYGSNGCSNYNAGPSCSIPASTCDGTNTIDNIYVNVDERVLPGSEVTVGVDYDCWADQSGGSTDVVSIWYHNGNSWSLIERWTEQAGELTGCDSNAGDVDGSLSTTFTLDNNVGLHTIRAIENDQDSQWPEETSPCPQPSTNPLTPYGEFDDLVLTVSPYQSKGIVPEGSGNPFYTTDNNPQYCNDMKGGDSCTTSWNVMANTDSGLYEFFVIYEPQNNNVAGTTSPLRGVNITALPSCPLEYDSQPCNGCIESNELFNVITDWFNNAASISKLMQNINNWKNGC